MSRRPEPNAALRQELGRYPAVLMEGAIIERIRRETSLPLDPHVMNSGLIYSQQGRQAMERIYLQYVRVAARCRLPMLMTAPTWKANPETVRRAGIGSLDTLTRDAVQFMRRLCRHPACDHASLWLGGLMGCRGDAYQPDEAMGAAAAEAFHAPQASGLAAAGVDFIMAATLPALSEAIGLARVLASQAVPYIISFVIRSSGALLDGTPLPDAIEAIDSRVTPNPAFYMLNCVHPDNVLSGLGERLATSNMLRDRLCGIQANTSMQPPEVLDGAERLDGAEPQVFADSLMNLYHRSGMFILGGCCGTDHRHIGAIADRFANR